MKYIIEVFQMTSIVSVLMILSYIITYLNPQIDSNEQIYISLILIILAVIVDAINFIE